MEKEKVLEIEITKIDDYWNAITVKKIKEDFKSNDLLEWITIGGNYVCNDKIFINRIYPNIPFIARNETTFIFKGIVDKINEKYGIPKRWRAKKEYGYFSIMGDGIITEFLDNYVLEDNNRYNLGNYFQTEKEAQKVIDSKEWQDFWAKVRAGEIGG
nr:MAG TPA: hypothetical protein [Caudoviricetes sp.]